MMARIKKHRSNQSSKPLKISANVGSTKRLIRPMIAAEYGSPNFSPTHTAVVVFSIDNPGTIVSLLLVLKSWIFLKLIMPSTIIPVVGNDAVNDRKRLKKRRFTGVIFTLLHRNASFQITATASGRLRAVLFDLGDKERITTVVYVDEYSIFPFFLSLLAEYPVTRLFKIVVHNFSSIESE